MLTRMIHPAHGAMHAYSVGEIEKLRTQGWAPEEEKESDTITMSGPETIADPLPITQSVEAMANEKRKPGRPRKG